MNPFFTIIIPVYNAEEYLGAAIQSVLQQSFTDFELLLVLNGSTDASFDICTSYEDGIKIRTLSIPYANVSAARNKGLEIATGEWIVFLDADDLLHTDCLSLVYDCLQKTSVEFVSFDFLQFSGGELPSNNAMNLQNRISVFSATALEREKAAFLSGKSSLKPCVWGAAFKHSLLSGMTFHEDLRVGEDACFMLEALLRTKSLAMLSLGLYFNRLSNKVSLSRNVVGDVTVKDVLMANQYKFALGNIWSAYRDGICANNAMHSFSYVNRCIFEKNASFMQVFAKDSLHWWQLVNDKSLISSRKRTEFWCYNHISLVYRFLLSVFMKIRNFL